jgi:poly-gamma-glutamate synthesis protein (capsule biosynthesis protein)
MTRMRFPIVGSFAVAVLCAVTLLAPSATFAAEAPPSTDATVALIAVGDLMCSTDQLAKGTSGGRYDFRPSFAPVASLLRSGDLTFGNFETTLRSTAPYHGYPTFRSPRAYADAARWAGFDVLTTANNHALDGGATGVRYTAAYLSRIGIAHTGTDKDGPAVVTHDGVRITVLAYSYATNGIHSPFAGAVNRIGLARMKKAITAAKPKADLVVLCLHWGTEYSPSPEAATRSMARSLIDAGADLILGSHPHVVRPVATYKGHYIVYSMGNFISGQSGGRKDLGLIISAAVTKRDEVTKVARLKVIPVYRDRTSGAGRATYRVVRISSELAHPDSRISASDRARMVSYRAYCRRMFPGLL